MLMRICIQKNASFSKALLVLGRHTDEVSNLSSKSGFSQFSRGFDETSKCGFSTMSIDNLKSLRKSESVRNYQFVVAATRELGIGKDGKLPWKLPSDLKFFKEITTTTSDPAKKNAVVMGRKTWESLPLLYRPLPGRLNVVLTRSQSSNLTAEQNVVICGSIPSALQLLAESPYSSSVEKVFVIGGGQIFRETMNAPGCEAIHLTEIETNIDCDTFIPAIDMSCFRLWYKSKTYVEKGMRFCFATYVRVRTLPLNSEDKSNGNSSSDNFEAKNYTFLPRMLLERRDN